MKKSWSIRRPVTWPITLFLALMVLASCRDSENATPTPFPATSTPAPTAAGEPLPVALNDLADNPEAYEGVYIQLTGQYRRLPRLVCRADPHPSPASWGVAGDSYLAPAGGYDAQLRALLPENLTVTAAGYWRQWQGPIGCGKRARPTQLWYLEGSHILSPSPIAQITLTPTFVGAAADVTAVAGVPTGESPGTPSPTVAEPEEPEVTSPAAAPTNTPATPSPTPTVFTPVTSSPTPMADEDPTATGDPNATVTATAGTGTATATTSATAGPTPTGGGYTTVAVDEIEPGLLGFEQLGANEKHNWPFYLDTSQTITVSVAAEPAVNLVLAILDAQETPIVEQNQAPAGQLETIAGRVLDPNEEYFIQVYAADGAPTSYVMTVWGDDSIVLRARNMLNAGAAPTSDTIGEAEVNYWFFAGEEGDTVTITVAPSDNSDLAFLLYWPDGTDVDDVYDGGHPGQPVTLSTTLPQTGVYTIQVEEWNFEPASYQISLTQN